MPCCNACKSSPVSWTGPVALASTSKCLMPLLKLETHLGESCQDTKPTARPRSRSTSGKGINPCHGDDEVLVQFTATLVVPARLCHEYHRPEQEHEKAGPEV